MQGFNEQNKENHFMEENQILENKQHNLLEEHQGSENGENTFTETGFTNQETDYNSQMKETEVDEGNQIDNGNQIERVDENQDFDIDQGNQNELIDQYLTFLLCIISTIHNFKYKRDFC